MRPVVLLVVTPIAIFALGCTKPSPPPPNPVGWGTVMSEIGRRFELFGRAATAGRWELADYELGEIDEALDTLDHAALPKEGHPEVLSGLLQSFRDAEFPTLKKACDARNPTTFAEAFAHAAKTCNECHHASGHGFIEVPTVAGRAIPNTDPTAK